MKIKTQKVTEWFRDNGQKDIYTFAWNNQRGYTWYSNETNDQFLNLFKEENGVANAIADGFIEESLRFRLNELVESRQHGVRSMEYVLPFQEKDRKCWRKISINNCFDEEGNCSDYLVHIVDFSEMTDVLREMVYQMDYDGLTGIYNSEKFYQEVSRLVTEYPEQEFAIIQLDFDRFKVVNDLFGTEVGDAILRYVGRILGNVESQKLCYGRVIADVFALCLPYQKEEEIIELIQNIDQQIREYPIDCRLVPAFGVYKVIDRSMPVSIMLDHAKLACHSVKGNIINNYAFYAEELREQVMQEVEIEKDMERALAERQFQLYLQPKYDISTGQIIGAEALCRWEHPEKGLLPPTLFIPLFERNGFIVKLDCYMWEETCRIIREWLDQGQEVKPISLNVSRMHAYNHLFEEEILNLVEKYQIPPRLLELELTESAYLTEKEGMYNAMVRLKEKGLLFSVDDFGTGYSSLNMLKNIPVDIVKLDREFLNEVTSSTKGRAIIRNMIAMANELNIRVIAEGVESVDQAAFLLEMGCELAQGYYYSRPLSVSDFEQRAFWDKTVTELGSQIQEVLGEKKRLLEELPFLQGSTSRRGKEIINNPKRLQQNLIARIKNYRKVILGLGSVLYEFDIVNRKSLVYFKEKSMEPWLCMGDYESFLVKTLQDAQEEYIPLIRETISLEALQKALQNGRDRIEISYRARNVLEKKSTMVHNVLILSGSEDGELQEVFLCILKNDNKEEDE
ncbi:MAG: GGDEF domain-containing protein [Lachnospiraceae bacterium]|nr:GGDEF domain-containing protein [Lachnospiraceae bacterium]